MNTCTPDRVPSLVLNRIPLAERLLLAALVLQPMRWWPPMQWLFPTAQASDLVTLAAALAWLFEGGARRAVRERPAWVGLLGLWWLTGLVAVALAPSWREAGALKLLGHAELACLAVLVADLGASADARRRIVVALVAGLTVSCVAAALGVALFYLGVHTPMLNHHGDLGAGHYPRIRGLASGANGFAQATMVALLLRASVPLALPRGLRRLLGAAAVVALPFTFSRGLASLVIGWLGVRARAVEGPYGPRRAFGLVPVGVAGALGLAFVLAIARWWIRWSPTRPLAFRLAEQPGTKWQIWSATVESIAAHPILGGGFGKPAWGLMNAHNLVLGAWAERGLLGLAALATLVALGLRRTWRASRAEPLAWGLFWVLVALVFEGLFLDVQNQRHLWVVLGLAATVSVPAGIRESSPLDPATN